MGGPDDQKIEDKSIDDAVEQAFGASNKTEDILVEAKGQLDRISQESRSKPSRLKLLKSWIVEDQRRKYVAIAALPLLVVVAMILPTSRYALLNTFGIRVSASLLVVDDKSTQPLPGAIVQVGTQSTKTNDEGVASFSKIKQGKQDLKVTKSGYESFTRNVTLGFGNNPLGDVTLNSSGIRVEIKSTSWVDDSVLSDAIADSGDSSATSDKEGIISLVLTPTDATDVGVKIKAPGYLEKTIKIDPQSKKQSTVQLVPDVFHYYTSKQGGVINAYRERLDGQEQAKILDSSPRDKIENLFMSANEAGDLAAFVSTLSGEKNSAGYYLTDLWIFDGRGKNQPQKADSGEQITPFGWVNGNYIYVKTVAGTSAGNAKRSRLMSYSPATSQSIELASSNYFSGVEVGLNSVFYSQAGYYSVPISDAYLFRVRPDGTGKTILFKAPAFSLQRTTYDTYEFSSEEQGLHYAFNTEDDAKAVKKVQAPQDYVVGKFFVDNMQHDRSLWVDEVDGKGVLMVNDIKAKTSKAVLKYPGIKQPVTLINQDFAIFRVVTVSETADYVINLKSDNPVPKKIRDVSNVPMRTGAYYR